MRVRLPSIGGFLTILILLLHPIEARPISASLNGVDLSIVEQAGDGNYVSPEDGVLTRFSLPKDVIGLLAHSDKAGVWIAALEIGDLVVLDYAGYKAQFVVSEIIRYEVFADVYAPDVYRRVYEGKYHVTLQTCINGVDGRLFVIAVPVRGLR